MCQVYFIQHFMHHKPVRQNFKSLLVCEVSGKSWGFHKMKEILWVMYISGGKSLLVLVHTFTDLVWVSVGFTCHIFIFYLNLMPHINPLPTLTHFAKSSFRMVLFVRICCLFGLHRSILQISVFGKVEQERRKFTVKLVGSEVFRWTIHL